MGAHSLFLSFDSDLLMKKKFQAFIDLRVETSVISSKLSLQIVFPVHRQCRATADFSSQSDSIYEYDD